MAPTVLTPQEETDAMEAGTSELKYCFAKENVSERIQSIFFHVGVINLARLSTFCVDEAELRTVLKDDMGLDAATGLKARAEVSGVICAWAAAKTRTVEMAKHLGELDSRRQMKPLLGSDYLIMKNAYESKFERLEDQDTPARVYLERRIAEMESGELRAESLQTILNRDQDVEEMLQPCWDSSGMVKLKRTSAEVEDPRNPEELRHRLSLMFTGIIFISLQHSNRKELCGFTPDFVHKYTAYLLGEHCWGLIAKDNDGNTIATPHWGLVVKYEYAIRKKAYREMNDTGKDLRTCLREAWLDPLTKERHFSTPLSISASSGSHTIQMTSAQLALKRPYEQHEETGSGKGRYKKVKDNKAGKGAGKGGKGAGKGSGKASGKGAGKSIPKGCAPKTPDGRAVCYGYNDKELRCRKPDCNFLHVCGGCFQKGHPMYACRSGNKGQLPNSGADTQGSQI